MRREISSVLTCMYSHNDYVPFHSACLHRSVNTYTDSKAQKIEANTYRECFWDTNSVSYSLLGTWQPYATPDWSGSVMEVLPWCLNVRLVSALHRQLDYDRKKQFNVFTCVSMCIIMQFRTHTLQSSVKLLARDWELIYLSQKCTGHHNI